jgi:hypothetical protein
MSTFLIQLGHVKPQELKEVITAALGKGPHPQGLDDCGPFTPHWAAHLHNHMIEKLISFSINSSLG